MTVLQGHTAYQWRQLYKRYETVGSFLLYKNKQIHCIYSLLFAYLRMISIVEIKRCQVTVSSEWRIEKCVEGNDLTKGTARAATGRNWGKPQDPPSGKPVPRLTVTTRKERKVKGKGKVVPVHAMKAYRGSRGIVPLNLNLDARWRWVVNLTPWQLYPWGRTPVHTEYEAVWAPEPVWTFWRRERQKSMERLQGITADKKKKHKWDSKFSD